MINKSVIDKCEWIEGVVKGRTFADIGGLWGTVNEQVTNAIQMGATKAAMIDMQTEGNEWWGQIS